MAELLGYLLTIDAIITWGLASLVYKYSLGKTEAKASIMFRIFIVSISTFLISLIFGNYNIFKYINSEQLASYLIACLISGCLSQFDMPYSIPNWAVPSTNWDISLLRHVIVFINWFSTNFFNK